MLTARVDVTHPIAHGMNERTDMFFDNSPVFRLGAAAAGQGIKAIAWFDTRHAAQERLGVGPAATCRTASR